MNSSSYQTREEDQLILAVKEEQVSVPPEGRVQLHVAIINKSPNEDYIDIQVKGVPADWITIDTPVVHVAAGEAKQVLLTVQPPPVPQSRVGQYPLDVRAVSQTNPKRAVTVRSVLTVAAYQSQGRIGVLLGSIHFSISPGSSIQIPILLQNRGLEADSFRLKVEGIPANWVSTNSALTGLEPSTSREILLTINVPRSSQAAAGRTPFTIQFISQDFPDQKTEVECILTIAAFSQFSASLEPATRQANQFGQVIINNEGNTIDTYDLSFQSPASTLRFEKAIQVARAGSQPGTEQIEIAYVEIPPGERIQVAAGERGVYPFRSRLRSRPIVGREEAYPFTVKVLSTENKSVELSGQVNEKGLIPMWLISTLVIGFLMFCLLLLIPLRGMQTSARATQTASFNQTQAVLSGQEDSDGDGLTNNEEIDLGTDPFAADTDGDGLLDGEEVKTYGTNPLLPDTDADGLQDGEEVHRYMTDPLNPDTDDDGLLDGDEIARGTDPLRPDTDNDGLSDGEEIRLGTDPLNPDTDSDGLLDGQENQNCPRPRDPDSDGDGIVDGKDLDPCDPANPSLTATAIAGSPTVVLPTMTPTATPVPTSPPAATLTPVPPSLQGTMVFESNRDGNFEIYALNLANQSMTRLTTNAAQDIQPALAADSVQVAYVSNQDGNNEIYLGGVDGRVPLNLTSHAADDQQPAWSPDGNWIAFTTNRDGNQEIYIMRSDGSAVRNLTNHPANDSSPAWFSVGGVLGSQDWIAFTSTRDGNQEIYKVRPDGTGLVNLTQNPANDHTPSGFAGGDLLAFVTDRGGNPEIYTMTGNGGAPTNLTNNPAQDLDPAIGSNGDWIAFSTDRDGNLEIYVIRIQGGAAYNLSRNPGQDRRPDW
ncbi:MAG: PD40 domain-containing protein [Anaerolineales bacterium]|nr:PD40 domain-containing protein [Anaerolineales bacterium]